MEKEKERERRCESTPRYFILLTFFFFSHFRIFLEVLCVEGVYVGRPPGVGARPSSGGKQEEKE
jgi:hypothetical protein